MTGGEEAILIAGSGALAAGGVLLGVWVRWLVRRLRADRHRTVTLIRAINRHEAAIAALEGRVPQPLPLPEDE
jgi:hypothetical protein